MVIFLDNNILMDVLLDRDKDDWSTQIIKKCEAGAITGYVSSNCLYICTFYLEKKYENAAKVKQILLQLLNILEIAPTPKKAFINACISDFKDLEDAFQHYSALMIPGIQCIVTRNTKDFQDSNLPVLDPEELLNNYFPNDA